MKIRLLQPYGFGVPGDILDPDPPVAQLLIERGVAEIVEPESTKEETKVIDSPARDKLVKVAARKRSRPGHSVARR
jgi:hypothetical protein